MEHMADCAGDLGVRSIILGMPHRGRFNIMIGMFSKSPESIFSAFNDLGADKEPRAGEYRYSSDVKYHMEAYTTRKTPSGKSIDMVV